MEDMEVLKKIIEIDSMSDELEKRTAKLIEDNELSVKKQIQEMEREILGLARERGKGEMERLELEGKKEAESLQREYELMERGFDEKFKDAKNEIEREIFKMIFSKGDV